MAPILVTPTVTGLLTEIVLSVYLPVILGLPAFLQNPNDLLFRKSFLHRFLLHVEETLTF